MKKLCLLVLACCLCLSWGCTAHREDSFVSVTPHSEQYATEPASREPQKADTYLSLRTLLLDFASSGVAQGYINVSQYGDTLTEDMAQAVDYVLHTDPIGAYAVFSIHYTQLEREGETLLQVNLQLRHNTQEIQSIRTVRGMENAEKLLITALEQSAEQLVMQVSDYEPFDFSAFVAEYSAAHPELVVETPKVSSVTYPQTGRVRVVDICFSYETDLHEIEVMQVQMQRFFVSAQVLVNPSAPEEARLHQAVDMLLQRYSYQEGTSCTPAYDLVFRGIGNSHTMAQVLCTLCKNAGLDCLVVSGEKNGEPWSWNLVRLDGQYYHLDLWSQRDSYGLHTDAEMTQYQWDPESVPSSETVPEPTEE